MDIAVLLQTKNYVMKRIKLSSDPPVCARIPQRADPPCKNPSDYVADKEVEHALISKDLIYRVSQKYLTYF